MPLRFPAAITALLLGVSVAQFAAAQPRPSSGKVRAVELRQGLMKTLPGALKSIGGYLKGAHDDPAQVRAAAATVSSVARVMPRIWPSGTWIGVGDSEARREIWTEPAAFQRRVAGFRAAAARMEAAAAAGEKARIGAEMRTLGASCSSCHDFFRKPR